MLYSELYRTLWHCCSFQYSINNVVPYSVNMLYVCKQSYTVLCKQCGMLYSNLNNVPLRYVYSVIFVVNIFLLNTVKLSRRVRGRCRIARKQCMLSLESARGQIVILCSISNLCSKFTLNLGILL